LSGRRAPGFSLPDSRLRQHDLQDYRGRVVLIDIMKTDCPHCQTVVQTLEKARKKYGPRIAVLTVVNPPDASNQVQAFIQQHNLTSPVLFDCGQMAASYLKVSPERPTIKVPHLFVIDRAGQIVEDFGYSAETKEIFEGTGLYPILDKLVAPAAKK
jgi:peroxiredoxin